MKRIMFIVAFCLPALCRAQFSNLTTIEIGTLSTTHIVFTSDLSYVDISKQDVIAAKVVEASKNMLAIKAKEPFDYETTISALEANGTMHTFLVRYNPYPSQLVVDTRPNASTSGGTVNTQIRPDGAGTVIVSSAAASQTVSSGSGLNIASAETSNFGKADAPTLEEIIKYPQHVFHIADRKYNLEVCVTNLYVYSDLIYVVISVSNKSDIGFEAGDAQFTVENVSRKQQELVTDKPVWAKSSYGSLSCAPRSSSVVGYTIPKLTLLKHECLRIYVYEKRGTRNLLLTLTDKDLNFAVSPAEDRMAS